VDTPNFICVIAFHEGVSLPAGSDKGYSPLTSTAFFEKKAAQKNFSFFGTLSRALPTLPSGRVSQQNAFVNEAVGGVDDPTARWFQQLKRKARYVRFKK
jgi:hypothetical protein